jgi:hypothetical protein
MKAIILACALALLAGKAQAYDVNECMNKTTCVNSVTVDSGTAKTCKAGSSLLCQCSTTRCGGGLSWYLSSTGSCNSGYGVQGLTVVSNKTCCVSTLPCPPPPQADLQGEEAIETSSSKALSASFEAHSPSTLAEAYWGTYNSVNRSPTGGRNNSTMAKLDVCMGDSDATAAVATNSATTCGNNYCGTSSNEYCNANTQEVCRDRCECAINGITHSSCNLL